MSNVVIRDIRAITTAPRGINLVVVKVETSEPGLYGLGCATFTQRYTLVAQAVEEYLKPLLTGKSVDNIGDIWQLSMGSSYWRNGPVLNNALSGVDEALWDIKGKMAGMPVYDLLGGKCRGAVAVYCHADGRDKKETLENVQRSMEKGYRHVRCQVGMYGGQMNGGKQEFYIPSGIQEGAYYNPSLYMKSVVDMFEYLRNNLGDGPELCHDVHERLTPTQALCFARELEPFHLFFLEDILPPEQLEWFRIARTQGGCPFAMGELFNNPLEWKTLITERLIDYIRIHISQIGGITPARKVAALCESFGVRTAWHGPNDITPIGVTAQLHLDFSSSNFGIQEYSGFSEEEQEVFPGCPKFENGYLKLSERAGWGIDFDEEKAKKYPSILKEHKWLHARLPDGTNVWP